MNDFKPTQLNNLFRFCFEWKKCYYFVPVYYFIDHKDYLNINTEECILTSVMELGGREFATATKPIFW